MVKIALDAGHGINTAGKRTPDGEREWAFNNAVLLACVNRLNQFNGVEIRRLDDPSGKTDTPLAVRTNVANLWKADVLVSIHHNANAGSWGSHGGVETYVDPTASQASFNIAAVVHPLIVEAMSLRDRGVKVKNLHMTRESRMPAILTEGGFMDSTTDIPALRSSARLVLQGEAIADGLAIYFDLKEKYIPAKKEDEELKFSSPALKKETETSLVSKAHRQIIVDAAVKAGAHASWADKLANGTLTDADLLGLAVKYTVSINK